MKATIKNDSFGDGLTLSGRPRKLRVDFDSATQTDAYYIATVLLKQLNPAQRQQIRELIEIMIAAKYDAVAVASFAILLEQHIKTRRIDLADVLDALQHSDVSEDPHLGMEGKDHTS